MSWTLLHLVAVPLLTLPQTAAQAGARSADKPLAALKQELEELRNKWMTRYRAEPKQRSKLGPYPSIDGFLDRAWKLVDPDPTTKTAGDTLCWIVRERAKAGAMNRALVLLAKHHLDNENLGPVCGMLQYQITPEVETFLRAVDDNSPSTEIRNQALYALARSLMRRASSIDSLTTLSGKERAKRLEGYKSYYGDTTIAILAKQNPNRLRKQAEKYFDQLVTTNKDTGKGSLAARAKRNLYELRNLAIGMMAPDITGEDVDGVKFSLSDYRGKVVVLDFWGDW